MTTGTRTLCLPPPLALPQDYSERSGLDQPTGPIYAGRSEVQYRGAGLNNFSDYQSKLDEAYQGEFYGLAMYRRIADARPHPDEKEKWRLLVRLEEVTRSVLEPVLKRHGMATDARPESLCEGERDAEGYMHLPWDQLMRRFSDELDADIDEYSALLAIAPPGDREAIRFLVDHEIVAKAFCEGELDGRPDQSAAPVEALLARAPSLLAHP
ncbi:hypothetical protein AB8880_08555 [Alphaproteobacteria bacterium LSUCC0684]